MTEQDEKMEMFTILRNMESQLKFLERELESMKDNQRFIVNTMCDAMKTTADLFQQKSCKKKEVKLFTEIKEWAKAKKDKFFKAKSKTKINKSDVTISVA